MKVKRQTDKQAEAKPDSISTKGGLKDKVGTNIN